MKTWTFRKVGKGKMPYRILKGNAVASRIQTSAISDNNIQSPRVSFSQFSHFLYEFVPLKMNSSTRKSEISIQELKCPSS
jgi:hypothetical protein